MVHLIAKLTGLLHDGDRQEAVVEQLRKLAAAGTPVELEPTRPQPGGVVMQAGIVDVSEQELFISAPRIDGANRPLVRNEELQLCVRVNGQALCGDVTAIGRARKQAGDETVYGYRLTLPDRFGTAPTDRGRDGANATRPKHYVVEAELRCLKRDIPVRGVIAALSEKMVHVRSLNAPDWLREGDRMSFVAQLPSPVGAVEQTVTVNSVSRLDGEATTMIGMTFVVPMHGVNKLLSHGPVRWG